MVLRKTVSSSGVFPSKMAAILITFVGWHDTSFADRSSSTKMIGNTKKMSKKWQDFIRLLVMESIFFFRIFNEEEWNRLLGRNWRRRLSKRDFRVTSSSFSTMRRERDEREENEKKIEEDNSLCRGNSRVVLEHRSQDHKKIPCAILFQQNLSLSVESRQS